MFYGTNKKGRPISCPAMGKVRLYDDDEATLGFISY